MTHFVTKPMPFHYNNGKCHKKKMESYRTGSLLCVPSPQGCSKVCIIGHAKLEYYLIKYVGGQYLLQYDAIGLTRTKQSH